MVSTRSSPARVSQPGCDVALSIRRGASQSSEFVCASCMLLLSVQLIHTQIHWLWVSIPSMLHRLYYYYHMLSMHIYFAYKKQRSPDWPVMMKPSNGNITVCTLCSWFFRRAAPLWRQPAVLRRQWHLQGPMSWVKPVPNSRVEGCPDVLKCWVYGHASNEISTNVLWQSYTWISASVLEQEHMIERMEMYKGSEVAA